jgi:hypothetical protein
MGLIEEANYRANEIREQQEAEKRKEQRRNENKDFVQLYRPHIDDVTELAYDNPTAFKIFMFLIKNMDTTNALSISNKSLQTILDMSKATICRAIKYLKDNGWLCVLKNGSSNVYIVNPDVAWTAYGDQKAYCKFTADVILTSAENAEYLKNKDSFNKFKTIDENFMKSVRENKAKWDNVADLIETETEETENA